MPLKADDLSDLITDIAQLASAMDAESSGAPTARRILEQAAQPIHEQMKSNASKVVIKEIRFGPQTDEHDYQFKLKHAINFLQEGSKVKAYVFFRGRSILFSEQGEKLLLRFAVELEEYGKAEQMPRLEGKRMIMMLAPNKKK